MIFFSFIYIVYFVCADKYKLAHDKFTYDLSKFIMIKWIRLMALLLNSSVNVIAWFRLDTEMVR